MGLLGLLTAGHQHPFHDDGVLPPDAQAWQLSSSLPTPSAAAGRRTHFLVNDPAFGDILANKGQAHFLCGPAAVVPARGGVQAVGPDIISGFSAGATSSRHVLGADHVGQTSFHGKDPEHSNESHSDQVPAGSRPRRRGELEGGSETDNPKGTHEDSGDTLVKRSKGSKDTSKEAAESDDVKDRTGTKDAGEAKDSDNASQNGAVDTSKRPKKESNEEADDSLENTQKPVGNDGNTNKSGSKAKEVDKARNIKATEDKDSKEDKDADKKHTDDAASSKENAEETGAAENGKADQKSKKSAKAADDKEGGDAEDPEATVSKDDKKDEVSQDNDDAQGASGASDDDQAAEGGEEDGPTQDEH